VATRKTLRRDKQRVAGVRRISKDREEQTSLETQSHSIAAWCSMMGAELVEMIEDRKSAYKSEVRDTREGPRRALQFLRAGAVDTIVVWKIDRIARNARDLLNFVHDVEQLGGSFVSVTESFDTSTPMGRAMMTMIAALAELESGQKSERILAWQEDRRAKRKTPTGPRPFGYRRERNELHVVEDEALIIKQLVQAVREGVSGRQLVKRLAQAGTPLTQRAIKRILISPTTAALRDVDGVFIDCSDVWEPLLDRETWDEMRSILLDPERKGRPVGGGRSHLLSGLLECGKDDCDGRFRIKLTNPAGPRYECKKCSQSVPAPDVESIIEQGVKDALDPAAWAALCRRGGVTHVDTHELERQLAEALALYESEELTFNEWVGASKKIKRDLAAVADEPVELPDCKDPRREWDTLDIDAKRLLIAAVMPRIVITKATLGLSYFDAARVTIPAA
jgi:DNA invertase Pin-like site-specific DNA recombinase